MNLDHSIVQANTRCNKCNRTVQAHPIDDLRPYLFILCDGSLVRIKKTLEMSPNSRYERKTVKKRIESPFALRRLKPTS